METTLRIHTPTGESMFKTRRVASIKQRFPGSVIYDSELEYYDYRELVVVNDEAVRVALNIAELHNIRVTVV